MKIQELNVNGANKKFNHGNLIKAQIIVATKTKKQKNMKL